MLTFDVIKILYQEFMKNQKNSHQILAFEMKIALTFDGIRNFCITT